MCSAAAAGRCDDELRLRGPKNVQDWLGVLSPQGGGDGWIVGRMLAAPEDSGVGVVECKSSQDAAAAFGLSVERVGKVLAFAVGAGQFVAVVTRGAQRLASAKLASVFKCSRRRVRPATAGECAAVFGFVASEIPPGAFAQPSSVCVVMDPGLWPAGTAPLDSAADDHDHAQGGCREEDGCGSAALRDTAAREPLGGDAAGADAAQLLFRTGRAWVGVMLTPSEVLACHRAHGHQVRVADVLEPRVGWSGCGVCMAQPRLGCSKGAKLVLLLLCAPYPLPASAAEEVASSRPPIETGREETGVLGGCFGGTTSSSSCSMI